MVPFVSLFYSWGDRSSKAKQFAQSHRAHKWGLQTLCYTTSHLQGLHGLKSRCEHWIPESLTASSGKCLALYPSPKPASRMYLAWLAHRFLEARQDLRFQTWTGNCRVGAAPFWFLAFSVQPFFPSLFGCCSGVAFSPFCQFALFKPWPLPGFLFSPVWSMHVLEWSSALEVHSPRLRCWALMLATYWPDDLVQVTLITLSLSLLGCEIGNLIIQYNS